MFLEELLKVLKSSNEILSLLYVSNDLLYFYDKELEFLSDTISKIEEDNKQAIYLHKMIKELYSKQKMLDEQKSSINTEHELLLNQKEEIFKNISNPDFLNLLDKIESQKLSTQCTNILNKIAELDKDKKENSFELINLDIQKKEINKQYLKFHSRYKFFIIDEFSDKLTELPEEYNIFDANKSDILSSLNLSINSYKPLEKKWIDTNERFEQEELPDVIDTSYESYSYDRRDGMFTRWVYDYDVHPLPKNNKLNPLVIIKTTIIYYKLNEIVYGDGMLKYLFCNKPPEFNQYSGTYYKDHSVFNISSLLADRINNNFKLTGTDKFRDLSNIISKFSLL
jgi:hypothetical protein